MCATTKTCALRDEHSGPCLGAYELDKAVNKSMKQLLEDLENADQAGQDSAQ